MCCVLPRRCPPAPGLRGQEGALQPLAEQPRRDRDEGGKPPRGGWETPTALVTRLLGMLCDLALALQRAPGALESCSPCCSQGELPFLWIRLCPGFAHRNCPDGVRRGQPPTTAPTLPTHIPTALHTSSPRLRVDSASSRQGHALYCSS